MLTNLHLKNFKSWKDTTPIKMAPLTVLFGANSSGKSSIEQFLLMLKQTVDSSDRKLVIFAGDQNTPVNLGSFEELVFARDTSNRLEFSFEWILAKTLSIRDPRSNFQVSGNRLKFEAEVGVLGKQTTLAVKHFEYNLKSENAQILMKVRVERSSDDKRGYKLDASPYELVRKQGKPWPLRTPTKFYGFPDEVPLHYQNADFVSDFALEIDRLLRSISYLGPLRQRGERLYHWTGGEPESVGFAGENTISALLAAKERRLNTRPGGRTKVFQELVAEKLKQMELIDEFAVNRISANRKEYEVKVRTPGSPLWVDLPDVGFGVSQVLPVIVQCLYAPIGSILFIEQPELHLHPRAQAHLADLFIDVLSSREDGTARGIQLIIETHSEHFLHRLQRRIAEKDDRYPITTDQIAAYYATSTDGHSVLSALDVDLYGNITNWPDKFFGDSMGDVFAMSKAAAQRRSVNQPSRNTQ